MKKTTLDKATKSLHWEHRKSDVLSYIAFLKKHNALPRTGSALDLGCAQGHDTQALTNQGLQATGIDISEEFIQTARENYPNLPFLVANAEDLPFDEEAFKLVYATNILFYLNTKKALCEMNRVLKSCGVAIITVDTCITKCENNTVLHAMRLSVFEDIAKNTGFDLVHVSEEITRVDQEPFVHEHRYHLTILRKTPSNLTPKEN